MEICLCGQEYYSPCICGVRIFGICVSTEGGGGGGCGVKNLLEARCLLGGQRILTP